MSKELTVEWNRIKHDSTYLQAKHKKPMKATKLGTPTAIKTEKTR